MKGTAMETWENTLSEEEILYVYAYVNSLKNSDEMMEHHEQNNSNENNRAAFKSNGEYFK
ncbi:hypothetical protein [Flavobacterium xueshanense]|uniref:Cytochrome c n=1 Tax=Flavobacterium xueshanense TaxID=935223 RepID=A0A1I2IVT7_9FLAO|nr:hypothetical protein [Flavobacterium xueshanense]SFF45097.1 hypothetical protein SAMN04488131_1241 [Flavobacterium xueshanense]